jgi:hypothetical protein
MTGLIDAPDDTVIWRYMDLARFVALVVSKRIRFTKLENLASGDPFEGFTRARGLRRPTAKRATSDGGAALYTMASSYAAKTIRNAPKHVYVNCWCAYDESMGVWQSYAVSGGGVAVRSTVGRFKSALQRTLRKDQYAFGSVTYTADLKALKKRHHVNKGPIPLSGNLWQMVLSRGFKKRTAYSYENEWRGAIFQEQLRPDIAGVDVTTDLDLLIESVHVGPRSDALMLDAVRAVMDGFGLKKTLARSSLLDRP